MRKTFRRAIFVWVVAALLSLGGAGGDAYELANGGSIYAALRDSMRAARVNNPRVNDVLADPPEIRHSQTAPEGLANFYVAGSAKGNAITIYGGVAVLSGSYWRVHNTSYPDGRTWQSAFRVGAWVDSAMFALKLTRSSIPFRLIVDNHYISLEGFRTQGDSAEDYVIIDFRKAGGRARRHVLLEWQGEAQGFGGILVAPSETVTKEAEPFLRGVFYGDSYMASGGAVLRGDGLPQNMADFMGVADCWPIAIGGTGYLNPGKTWPYIAHVSDLTAMGRPPDFIVVGSAGNDVHYTHSQITEAVMAFHAAVRREGGLRNTPIFFVGAWSNESGPDADHVAADRAVGLAVGRMISEGDGNVFYIPSAADPNGPDIYGTSNETAPNGSGNTDQFGIPGGHLNSRGWRYLAHRLVDKIERAIEKKL